jgi:hypothetical protein
MSSTATNSCAELVTVEFSGTFDVEASSNGLVLPAGAIPIGTPFSGRMTFETEGTVDVVSDHPDGGLIYLDRGVEGVHVVVHADSYSFDSGFAPSQSAFVRNGEVMDMFSLIIHTPLENPHFSVERAVSLQFVDSTREALSSLAIPSGLDLADFDEATLQIRQMSCMVILPGQVGNGSCESQLSLRGTITDLTAVPEPNSVSVVATLAVFMLTILRRRGGPLAMLGTIGRGHHGP